MTQEDLRAQIQSALEVDRIRMEMQDRGITRYCPKCGCDVYTRSYELHIKRCRNK